MTTLGYGTEASYLFDLFLHFNIPFDNMMDWSVSIVEPLRPVILL